MKITIFEMLISFYIDTVFIRLTAFIILGDIVYFSAKFKCRKKHYHRYFNPCFESDCKWALFCDRYCEPCTDDTIAEIAKLIEEKKQETLHAQQEQGPAD